MLEWFQQLMTNFKDVLITVLPLSPFLQIENSLQVPGYVNYLNWFLPIPEMLTVLSAWLFAYALYLLYRIILRWIKAVA